MRKIYKSQKGFTLIEMILVIAIIVILASVLFIAVGRYIENANTAKIRVSTHNSLVDSLGEYVMSAIALADA
jgi:prepilin-type N-terminal cleavage/methylation domain-containing protein